MKLLCPSYYPQFSCIADKCRHSCCIGWEIDIDHAAYDRYQTESGARGDRLRANIADDETGAHFVLCGEDERCPFLNERGLCDLILARGEGYLCQICTDHPRFRSFFSDHTEIGLGLCCEAAASLVLGWQEPVSMLCLSDNGAAEEPTANEQSYSALFSTVISALQNRQKPMEARIADMLSAVGAQCCEKSMTAWAQFLSGLEILDDAWRVRLSRIGEERAVLPGHAGEQFLVYLLYRHLPKMLDGEDAAVIVSFAVFAYDLICALYEASDVHDFAALCEIVRQFSSELEYSEDNLYAIFDEIAWN